MAAFAPTAEAKAPRAAVSMRSTPILTVEDVTPWTFGANRPGACEAPTPWTTGAAAGPPVVVPDDDRPWVGPPVVEPAPRGPAPVEAGESTASLPVVDSPEAEPSATVVVRGTVVPHAASVAAVTMEAHSALAGSGRRF